MTVNSYLLTPRSDSSSPSRSSGRTAGTTSCQILLSRGVSDVSDPFHPQADTEAPRMNTVTVFESPSHHIMALAEPPPLGRAESMEADATTQSQEGIHLSLLHYNKMHSYLTDQTSSVVQDLRFKLLSMDR